MNYLQMKTQHQKEIDNFPLVFAFNDDQFKEGMQKLGLKETDTDKVYALEGTGGFYRKTDAEKLWKMFERHGQEMEKAMKDEEFAFQMFEYELANHEFCVTGNPEPTLDALGLTREEVKNNPTLDRAFKKALEPYYASTEAIG